MRKIFLKSYSLFAATSLIFLGLTTPSISSAKVHSTTLKIKKLIQNTTLESKIKFSTIQVLHKKIYDILSQSKLETSITIEKELQEIISLIDHFNSLFDLNHGLFFIESEKVVSSELFSDLGSNLPWFEILDQRIYLLELLSQKVDYLLANNLLKKSLLTNTIVKHPYTLMYLIKAAYRHKSQHRAILSLPPFASSDLRAFEQYFYRKLQTNFLLKASKNRFSNRPPVTSQNFRYLNELYKFQIAKFFVEIFGILSKSTVTSPDYTNSHSGPARFPIDHRYYYYRINQGVLQRAYNTLKTRYYGQPSSSFTIHPGKVFTKIANGNSSESLWSRYRSKSKNLVIGPKIILLNSNAIITAHNIYNHPLTLIKTEGFSIDLMAESITNLWIDTSPSNKNNRRKDGSNAGAVLISLFDDGAHIVGEHLIVARGSNGKHLSCTRKNRLPIDLAPGKPGKGGSVNIYSADNFNGFTYHNILNANGFPGSFTCQGKQRKATIEDPPAILFN